MNRRLGWMLMLTAGIVSSSGCGIISSRNGCNSCNCSTGCRPGPIGWQRGGTDYQNMVNHGALANWRRGSDGASNAQRGLMQNQSSRTGYQNYVDHDAYRNQQAGSGVPAAAVAYPYYTNRGPRDFLVNNPPTIGR